MRDVETRMFNAYFRRFGKNADQPSGTVEFYLAKNKQRYGVLSNCNGVLAVYRIQDDESLKFIDKEWFETKVK